MPVHLPAAHHGRMDLAPARYTIRINGHLGAMMLSAFPAMVPQWRGAETVLTGLLDRSALYGVLAEIDALGPALNEQGYHVGRVERNLYYVTDGVYQSAFLATDDDVVLFDASCQSSPVVRARGL